MSVAKTKPDDGNYNDWPSSSSNISNPTTVIRWYSPHDSFQTHLRSHSQLHPTHSSSFSCRQNLVSEEPVQPRPSRNEIPSLGTQALSCCTQESSTFGRRPDSWSQSNDASTQPADDALGEQIYNLQGSDLNTNSSIPVDNTPFIQFAIEQLTRAEEYILEDWQPSSLNISSGNYAVDSSYLNPRISKAPLTQNEKNLPVAGRSRSYVNDNSVLGYGLSYMTPEREREGLALARKYRSPPSPGPSLSLYPKTFTGSIKNRSQLDQISVPSNNASSSLLPTGVLTNSKKNPQLTFIPWILRLRSMIILSLLCIFMIMSLLFCSIYSRRNGRLVDWHGDMSRSQYFLLKYGPQLYAAFVFLYVQIVISTIIRIMPFNNLAMNDSASSRSDSIFLRIYPLYLRPVGVNNTRIDICLFLFWLSAFTIPLQSSLFSVDLKRSNRCWVTTQGVAWTLIIIYSLIFVTTIVSGSYFFGRITGLKWDPRSLADISAMLPNSDALNAFAGSDILKSKKEIRHKIGLRSWRLGYWTRYDNPVDVLYCLGEKKTGSSVNPMQTSQIQNRPKKLVENQFDNLERGGRWYDRQNRYRFIPWYLRKRFAILWPAFSFIIWLLLVLVFFLPVSAIKEGFTSLISILVSSTGFSSAQFLISFGPSLIGMLLYLLFQSLDMRLRILKPWAELSNPDGSTADESLLLDYPAALPVYVSLSAFSAAHYRICVISFLSTLFILLPIISGGLLYPQKLTPTGEIRIFPSMIGLIILVILLGLYVLGLLLVQQNPDNIYLPHDVSCLAEIISFLYNSHILEDAAFHNLRSKVNLTTNLMAEKTIIHNRRGDLNRWAFGVYKGRNGKDSMGIERVGRNPGVGLMIMSAR